MKEEGTKIKAALIVVSSGSTERIVLLEGGKGGRLDNHGRLISYRY